MTADVDVEAMVFRKGALATEVPLAGEEGFVAGAFFKASARDWCLH